MTDLEKETALHWMFDFLRNRVSANLRVPEASLPPASLMELISLIYLQAGHTQGLAPAGSAIDFLTRAFGSDGRANAGNHPRYSGWRKS